MTTELTPEQQETLDRAAGSPAHVRPAGAEVGQVLLRVHDYDWIGGLLGDLPNAARLRDPRTGEEFVLVSEDQYERFRAFFEEDPITPAEQRHLVREFGRRAGWDDPEMDVYDRLYGNP